MWASKAVDSSHSTHTVTEIFPLKNSPITKISHEIYPSTQSSRFEQKIEGAFKSHRLTYCDTESTSLCLTKEFQRHPVFVETRYEFRVYEKITDRKSTQESFHKIENRARNAVHLGSRRIKEPIPLVKFSGLKRKAQEMLDKEKMKKVKSLLMTNKRRI